MCHHTREPTVLSRVSCRPSHLNFDRFHQPCLLPWRTPYCHRNTAGCWAGIGKDCRLHTTWRPLTLFGQPGSSSLCVSLEVVATPTRRYHGRMLIPPSPPLRVPPPPRRLEHTRKFGTLSSPPPPVTDIPWGRHLRGHPSGGFLPTE